MMHRKAVPLPCEDVVSLAASAAWPIVAALSPDELSTIRTLIVATESGVDFSKSASTYVHRLLGLSRNCRLFEVKQACHAGVAALRSAAALVGHEGGRALVIAGDIPTAARGTYAEPSQGRRGRRAGRRAARRRAGLGQVRLPQLRDGGLQPAAGRP
ncbi:hypothetical protein ACFQZ4_42960 [Catellatospora coxensis]